MSDKNRTSYMETSKKIAFLMILIYIATCIIILVLSIKGIDTSAFSTQMVITTGGICAAALVSYFVKANRENIIKEKKELIKWEYEFKKRNLIEIDEDPEETLNKDINDIKESLENKLDKEVDDSINNDPELPNIHNF